MNIEIFHTDNDSLSEALGITIDRAEDIYNLAIDFYNEYKGLKSEIIKSLCEKCTNLNEVALANMILGQVINEHKHQL